MPDTNPHALRRRIDRLDRRIARVEMQVATVTGAASELERAGLFERDSTEQLVGELWLMVERLKALRDGWVELHACLSGERVTSPPPQGRDLLH